MKATSIEQIRNGEARLQALANRCRNRGGDCPCTIRCQALCTAAEQLEQIAAEERAIKRRREHLEQLTRRLQTKPATLKDGFVFDSRYEPVMVFDGDVASFGYEDSNGDWIECNEWPFNEQFIWADDCERFGIRVE